MSDKRDQPLLYDKFPNLRTVPWIPLAPLDTPVEKMTKLGAKIGSDSIYIKRDDLSSPLYGGNKVRKFEFFFADFLAKKRKHMITMGGIGSNHALASTIFVDYLKYHRDSTLHSVIGLFNQPVTTHVRENLLLDHYFGADIVYSPGYAGLGARLIGNYIKRRKAYFMWPGASRPIGTLGFVNAALELKQQIDDGQMPEPDKIYVACGSAGTAAGLALGVNLAGLNTEVVGVQVSMEMFASTKAVKKLGRKTMKLMRKHDKSVPALDIANVHVEGDYYGGTYGLPTRRGIAAIELIRETEGIHLDVTYTGKALAGLLDYIAKSPSAKTETLLFWNTLNGRDFSEILKRVDYHDLPTKLHWVFEQELPALEPADA